VIGTSGYDHNNIFAQILQDKIPSDRVYQHPLALCFKNIAPLAPTHLLLIPTGPYTDIDAFGMHASNDEVDALLAALTAVTNDISYSISTNTARGPLTHQEIYHFHLHITSPPIHKVSIPANAIAQEISTPTHKYTVYRDPIAGRLWFGKPGEQWLPEHLRLVPHLVSALSVRHGHNIQGYNGVWQLDWD